MSKNTPPDPNFDFSAFNTQPYLSSKRTISIPSSAGQPPLEQLPSGFDPMGEVRLEGRAYRGLSRGKTPWWILVTSWVAIALPVLLLSGYIIYASLQPLLTGATPLNFLNLCSALLVLGLHLMVPSLILIIIGRGTIAKFRHARR